MSRSIREGTLARFRAQRRTWDSNLALRTLYGYWYAEIRSALAPVGVGFVLEIGSGPGFARQFLPGIRTSDTVKAEWHDYELDAVQSWPVEAESVDAIVLFDVLHHLADIPAFFGHAVAALRCGGRLIVMEPYISPVSHPVYRFLHEEAADMRANPFVAQTAVGRDPFESNQALPTLLFGRYLDEFNGRCPALRIIDRRVYSGFSYVASGGFSHRPWLPTQLWQLLFALDRCMPAWLARLNAFRMLVVMEKRPAEATDAW